MTVRWYGEELKGEVKEIAKKAVKETADAIAEDARKDVGVDTEGTRNSIHVRDWEKEDAVGAYVKAGEKGREHVAFFLEVGSKEKPAKSFLRKNLKKHKGKLRKSMTGKLR